VGFETIQSFILSRYKPVNDIKNFVYLSQLVQADAMKIAIEAHRRAKPYCMGTLYWQMNDCWPATSWSTIDYYGNRKASYYQAKRSYKEIILSVDETESAYAVYIV